MHCVMSCNIRFANPGDGKNDWPYRKDFIREIIENHEADIIGTQEGREPQLRELAQLLHGHQLIDQHREWIEERMYPCLFINPLKFSLKDSGDIWLSETPYVPGSHSFDSAFPRLCTYAHLIDKENKSELFVINCHLDHVKEETRTEQIKVLIKEVKKVSKDLPLLLMGDFNSSPKSIVREILVDLLPNIQDPWINQGLEEETTFHKFDGLDPDGSKTRIDWILHDKEISIEEIKLIKESKNGLFPSDHFFVMAKFKNEQ